MPLPAGLAYRPGGGVILNPDEEVQARVRLVFTKFQEQTSAKAVRGATGSDPSRDGDFHRKRDLFGSAPSGGAGDGDRLLDKPTTPTIVAPQVFLGNHLKALKLPTFAREYKKTAMESARDSVDYAPRLPMRAATETQTRASRPFSLNQTGTLSRRHLAHFVSAVDTAHACLVRQIENVRMIRSRQTLSTSHVKF